MTICHPLFLEAENLKPRLPECRGFSSDGTSRSAPGTVGQVTLPTKAMAGGSETPP